MGSLIKHIVTAYAIWLKLQQENVCINVAVTELAIVSDLVTTIASVTSSLAIEQREKEKRQLNFIIHNVPVSKSSHPLTRKKEDTDFV